jgi:mannose-6-phosphate isomerase class I
MCLKGNVEINDDKGNNTTLRQGETVLVPACTAKLQLKGNAQLITATAL